MSKIMETVKETVQAAAAAFDAPPESFSVVDEYGNEWTYVLERTCRDEFNGKAWCFKCDICGRAMPWKDSFSSKTITDLPLHYCPSCGAKVVE